MAHTESEPECADLIDTPHIAEALQYRKREGDLAEWPGAKQRLSCFEEATMVPPNFTRVRENRGRTPTSTGINRGVGSVWHNGTRLLLS